MHHTDSSGSVQTEKGERTMPDREKVIKGLEICSNNYGAYYCPDCPYDILAVVQPDFFCADGVRRE